MVEGKRELDVELVRAGLIEIRDQAQKYLDQLALPLSQPLTPNGEDRIAAFLTLAQNVTQKKTEETVDKSQPMFVWKTSSKGFTVEFWPMGEKIIPSNHNKYVKAFNVKPEHVGLSLASLEALYPLTTGEK